MVSSTNNTIPVYSLKKIAPFLLISIFVCLCLFSQFSNSVTVDEFSHFPSGLYVLKTHDWRMNKEAPPLIKCFPALSSVITNPKIETRPFLNSPNTWSLGYSFMNLNKDRYQSIFTYGRCMIIFLGALLGFLIYYWGKELYGYQGALFALLLYVFNPNILAHSSLITIDIGASLTIFFSVYCFWKYLKKPAALTIVIAGLALGLAQLSKFTALLLYPVYFIILVSVCVVGIYQNENEKIKSLAANSFKYGKDFFIIILISIFVINLGYLFSNSFAPLSAYNFSNGLLKNFSSLFPAGFSVPLPYDYLAGFDYQLVQSGGRLSFYVSYLMGQHSLTGWWYYYLIAFLVKNPVPLLIILFMAVIACLEIKLSKIDTISFLCIWVPSISYLIYFSFFTHTPIGIRYLLPIFPFLFLASGYLFNEAIIKFKSIKYILALLAISCVASSFIVFPNYLSYFNIAAGGPKNGSYWLIDSNLDWGQSLPGLKKYMDKNNINEIKLGYFGRVDPEIYGINYSLAEKESTEGIYAISINFLVGRPYYLLKEDTHQLIYADINYFDKFRYIEPSAVIDNTIYIFDVKK
jgi:hypothetical protein